MKSSSPSAAGTTAAARVVEALGQDVARGLVPGPALNGPVGDLLLLAEALLLGLGGSPVFGELFLGDGVGRRVVDAAGRDKQMHDALPLSDLGRTTGISSAPLHCDRGLGGRHPGGAAANPAPASLRVIDRPAGARLHRAGRTVGARCAGTARHGHCRPRLGERIQERTTVQTLGGGARIGL
ncbi:hypothetical protein [Streptomyces clavuligerus]|uniref:hypothetical protein n=1 Tax=Streptomyces clavuligerus TaxID=1901 RepID=UPI001967AA01|nr:hypothetical protein [Streptomyces clavuligerus]